MNKEFNTFIKDIISGFNDKKIIKKAGMLLENNNITNISVTDSFFGYQISATVKDNEKYHNVIIETEENKANFFCTCGKDNDSLCVHTVAVLLSFNDNNDNYVSVEELINNGHFYNFEIKSDDENYIYLDFDSRKEKNYDKNFTEIFFDPDNNFRLKSFTILDSFLKKYGKDNKYNYSDEIKISLYFEKIRKDINYHAGIDNISEDSEILRSLSDSLILNQKGVFLINGDYESIKKIKGIIKDTDENIFYEKYFLSLIEKGYNVILKGFKKNYIVDDYHIIFKVIYKDNFFKTEIFLKSNQDIFLPDDSSYLYDETFFKNILSEINSAEIFPDNRFSFISTFNKFSLFLDKLEKYDKIEFIYQNLEYDSSPDIKIKKDVQKENNYYFEYSGTPLYDYSEISKNKKYIFLENKNIIKIDKEKQKSETLISKNLMLKNIIYFDDNFIKETIYDLVYSNPHIPDPQLKYSLRNYQKEGIKYLCKLYNYRLGGILADDMGLGKTVQILGFLSITASEKTNLIIVPSSLIYNWENEIIKSSSLSYKIIKNVSDEIDETKDINLISYNLLRLNQNIFLKNYDKVLLDEAQYVKNSWTSLYKNVLKIKSDFFLAITGTPLENTPEELYNIYGIVLPGLFISKKHYKNLLKTPEGKNTIIKKMTPFIIRRTKSEVLKDLPEKISETVYVDLNETQKEIYNYYIDLYKEKISSGEKKDVIIALEGLLRLRQICDSPSLFIKNYTEISSKEEYLISNIKKLMSEGRKTVIFTQFLGSVKNIEKIFSKEKTLKITGSIKNKFSVVEEFNSSKDKNILICSLKAAGLGLNITSASTVIHYDPWWNPAVENQATDRVHRYGQKNTVLEIKLVSKNTVEEKIMLLKSKKEKLYGDFIGSKQFYEILSKEEIFSLFSRD